jgi:hypothetical protein
VCLTHDPESDDGDFYGDTPLPAEPTEFAPGTLAKVAVLEQRAARGEALFHPHDDAGDPAFPRDEDELRNQPRGPRLFGRTAKTHGHLRRSAV